MSSSDDLVFFEEFDRVNATSYFFIITHDLRKGGTLPKLIIKLCPSKVFIQSTNVVFPTSQLQNSFDLIAVRTIFFRKNCKIHINQKRICERVWSLLLFVQNTETLHEYIVRQK